MEFNKIFSGKLSQHRHNFGMVETGERTTRPRPALFVFTLLVAVLVAGCGGGGGDTPLPPGGTPPPDGGSPGGGGNLPPDGGGFNPPPNQEASTDPVQADPGDLLAARVGGLVTLDGSASSTSLAGPLTYAWAFAARPGASKAELQNVTSANPSFIADIRGPFAIQLVVTSAGISSQRAVAFVEVTNDGEPYTGPKLHTRGLEPKGFSSRCVVCHADPLDPNSPGVGWVDPKKAGNHVATSNVCEVCHSTFGFSVISFVDHSEVFGICSDCHDGVSAVGKSASHVPTTLECDDCHNTTSFLELALDGSYDHTGIKSNCVACHTGVVAIGKHVGHILTDSDCSACHITDNFQTVTFDHSNISGECAACHGVTAVGKSQNHPATTADCGMCHNTETFVFDVNRNFDHTTVVGELCASCHTDDNTNPNRATGKSLNHIPTTEDCGICHSPGTFASGVFDHAGVVDGCASCHNGVISTGVTANHVPVPTTQDCAVCHLSTDTFTGAAFDHAGIVDSCATCHDGNIAIGKPSGDITKDRNGVIVVKVPIHIPTQGDCSVCHVGTNSGDFASPALFLATVHPGISGGCEGCHSNDLRTMLPAAVTKGVDHLPTDQDCRFCHTVTAFTPTVFDHSGITGNCASCHDGKNDATGAIGVSVDHILTTVDCAACHNTASFTPAFVDHSSPEVVGKRCDSCHDGVAAKGTNPGHVSFPATQDCSACHVTGTFANAVFNHEGIVDNCASCHDGANAVGTVKSVNHVPTTEDCAVCHNTTVFAGARFDHRGIVDNCATCHDGNTATGKSTRHVPTNGDCAQCHVTTGFIPATAFDHAGIVDNCVSCHDGAFAIGKTANHPSTTQDCGVCHTTSTFTGAGFDHTGVVDNCASCHVADGSGTARGFSPNHIQTGLDCALCHTTATFVGGTWDHQGTIDNCESCHNGTTATGKSQGHFVTTQECNVCHTTQSWGLINYTHATTIAAVNLLADNHNPTVGCLSCHRDNRQDIAGFPDPTYGTTCAACHAGDYDFGESDHNGLPADADCAQSGCHRVSDRNWD